MRRVDEKKVPTFQVFPELYYARGTFLDLWAKEKITEEQLDMMLKLFKWALTVEQELPKIEKAIRAAEDGAPIAFTDIVNAIDEIKRVGGQVE